MLSSLVSVESAAEQDFLANLLSNNPSKTCVIVVIDVIVVVVIVLCCVSMCTIVVSFIKVREWFIA